MYMVPPFLAYYGVLSQNQTLLGEAYTQVRAAPEHLTLIRLRAPDVSCCGCQIKLYRNYLIDNSAGGLWKHVLLGDSGNDEGHWSTGESRDRYTRLLGRIER